MTAASGAPDDMARLPKLVQLVRTGGGQAAKSAVPQCDPRGGEGARATRPLPGDPQHHPAQRRQQGRRVSQHHTREVLRHVCLVKYQAKLNIGTK